LIYQNEEVKNAVKIICENAKTPYPADGLVYVSDVNDTYKIKTGKSIRKINI
jgi:nitrogen regulatory protein P-II 1